MATLVAGGAGFVGSHLCDHLIDSGEDVICIDNLSTGRIRNISHLLDYPAFTLLEHDVTVPLPELPGVERVYHLASPASPAAYQERPIETLRANSEGTFHLLELSRKQNARFLFASTSEIYGDPLEHPQRETYVGNVSSIGPRSMYDEAKRYGEALTTAIGRVTRVQVRIARIFNTYGPRMDPCDGRVVSNFIVQALSGQPITIYGDGAQTRSFQYVDDLVDGLIRLMDSDYALPVNLGNPVEYRVRDLATEILAAVGSTSGTIQCPLPEHDPRQRRPDISLARQLLEWSPTVKLTDGLERTIAYFRELLGDR